MSGKQESIGDVLSEWRDMVCYHEGPVHPLNHGAVMHNLDRIEAAWSRLRGIVAELANAVRECNGEKYHVTLLRDADAIVIGETPNCPSFVQKQGCGLDNSVGNAAAMRSAKSKTKGENNEIK